MPTGFLQPVQSITQSLPSAAAQGGYAITDATLSRMAQIARKYRRDATIATLARQITRNVGERDASGTINTLQRWVRDSIKYVNDPRGIEMVQTPVQTVNVGTGDCDDKSTLLATLLETMGLTTRFAAVAMGSEPSFSHVMAQVRLGTRWINLETILPGIPAGWTPPDVTNVRYKNV